MTTRCTDFRHHQSVLTCCGVAIYGIHNEEIHCPVVQKLCENLPIEDTIYACLLLSGLCRAGASSRAASCFNLITIKCDNATHGFASSSKCPYLLWGSHIHNENKMSCCPEAMCCKNLPIGDTISPRYVQIRPICMPQYST